MNIKSLFMALLIIMTSSPLNRAYSTWVYVPEAKGELRKGDIILTTNPAGLIAPIMGTLGWYFHHTLVVIDDQGNMRENNTDYKELEELLIINEKVKFKVYSKHWPRIKLDSRHFDIPLKLDPELLSNLIPGISNYGNDYNGTVNKSDPGKNGRVFARLTIQDENNRPHLEAIADEMLRMKGYYMLHSYINLEAYEPTWHNAAPELYVNGGHCSGTAWWSHNRAGGLQMSLPLIDDPDLITAMALNMHQALVESFTQKIIYAIYEIVTGTKDEYIDLFEFTILDDAIEMVFNFLLKDYLNGYCRGRYKKQVMDYIFIQQRVPEKLANQMINTFLFNRSWDMTRYWEEHCHEVAISSIAPDHLLMAAMPSPNGIFWGEQTRNTSYYNAIEDYTTSGGYYIELEEAPDNAPENPSLEQGLPAKIAIATSDSTTVPNNGEINLDFELIPMPEEYGGMTSKRMRFNVKNNSLVTPLELTGEPAVSLSGDAAFDITSQPPDIVDQKARASFEILFTGLPDAPGSYSTVFTIPNSDPDNSLYQTSININAINEAYFTENPIYYNQLEDEDDMYHPLIGHPNKGKLTVTAYGPYHLEKNNQAKFNKGYGVYEFSKTCGHFSMAEIHPFGKSFYEDKPDLAVGTCAFWAKSKGGWRGDGKNTHLSSRISFNLNNDISIKIYSENIQNTLITLSSMGSTVFSGSVAKGSMVPYVLQWNFTDGFSDGTNVRFYYNGTLRCSVAADVSPSSINAYMQNFVLLAVNTRSGDNRDTAESILDNIIIWNNIVNPVQVMAINAPKTDIE